MIVLVLAIEVGLLLVLAIVVLVLVLAIVGLLLVLSIAVLLLVLALVGLLLVIAIAVLVVVLAIVGLLLVLALVKETNPLLLCNSKIDHIDSCTIETSTSKIRCFECVLIHPPHPHLHSSRVLQSNCSTMALYQKILYRYGVLRTRQECDSFPKSDGFSDCFCDKPVFIKGHKNRHRVQHQEGTLPAWGAL